MATSRSALPPLLLLQLWLFAGPAAAQDVRFSGEVSTAIGASLETCGSDGEGDCALSDYNNRNVVALQVDAALTEKVGLRAGASLHNVNSPDVESAEDTTSVGKVQRVSLRIDEAWVEAYDFLAPGLDLRVGSQRVRWGTGDGYSPSDRLNPLDLEDPTRFDRRLATPALRLAYHVDDWTFSTTWMPLFIPSLLAPNIVEVAASSATADTIDLGAEVQGTVPEVHDVRTRIELPGQSLFGGSIANRVQWGAPFGDVGFGWYLGRDTLPALSGEVVPESFFEGNQVDLLVNLRYPAIQMMAVDYRSAPFGGLTAWLDAALILPERTKVFITQSRLEDLERLNVIDRAPNRDIEVGVQSGKPYVSWVAGLDRSFGRWLYANLQYVRGFLFERNPDELHHYLLAALRVPAEDSPFEAELRGGGETTPDLDAFGVTGQLKLTYRHEDYLRFGALVLMQDGQDTTTLGAFSALSEARLEASAQF